MAFISLVKWLTLADIRGGVFPPRNAVIANVFYQLELIESCGTEIQKILESYAGHFQQAGEAGGYSACLPPVNMARFPASGSIGPRGPGRRNRRTLNSPPFCNIYRTWP